MTLTPTALQGFKYFKMIKPLLRRLHDVGTERDRAGNRELFFDEYASLVLLYFFNPVITSLRGIHKTSDLASVQKQLGCKRASLGSLSEASRVFDAERLQPLIHELADEAGPLDLGKDAEALVNLTAADGSLLPALPKMAWALWVDEDHRAAKLHLQFDVLKGVPCAASVTAGNGSENDQLRAALQPGRLYAIDRGFAEYQLFQDIIDASSSFIGRIRDNAVYEVVEERPLSEDARRAGVVRDLVVWLGCEPSGRVFKQPLRIVEVSFTNRKGRADTLLLATDRLELDAALIALGYKFRWTVELFFRWFKCILGCQHLLSHCQNGVKIQVYLAIIASLLVSLWTGRKPTKRTYEMLCFFFMGLASEEELLEHIDSLEKHAK